MKTNLVKKFVKVRWFYSCFDVIQLPKDKRCCELALRNGNVKLIEYRWKNGSQTGEGG